jgi:DNA-binding transcriptional LysR family regulator
VNDRNIVETWPYIAHKWEGREIAHRLINQRTGEESLFQFQRAATLNTLKAVFRVMSEEAGIAVIPEPFVRPSLEAGAVLPILTDFHPRQVGIFAVHPFGNLPPTSVRIMIEVMKGTAAG